MTYDFLLFHRLVVSPKATLSSEELGAWLGMELGAWLGMHKVILLTYLVLLLERS